MEKPRGSSAAKLLVSEMGSEVSQHSAAGQSATEVPVSGRSSAKPNIHNNLVQMGEALRRRDALPVSVGWTCETRWQ